MTTATLPQVWRGRSGRTYVPAEVRTVRHGGTASVRKVVGRGGPVGTSTVADGVPLALKLWNEGDEEALDQLQAEARILSELSAAAGELPCPRLYDLVGAPVITGLVMEWCPADLERWWREKLSAPDAFGRLMAALSEATRRVGAYHEHFLAAGGALAAHGDLKPSNLLIDTNGRWLISDFGAARVRPPSDDPLGSSRVIAGTENFIAPEALFHAHKPHPPAMDTWALGATAFALLSLRRVVLDGGPVPRNGTHSARFRAHRVHQVLDLYGREPTRFRGRELEPGAFPDPDMLPLADERTVRESLRGVFGLEDPIREQALCEEVVHVLDRALVIDPARRYTSADELFVAFEHLTRTYIGLAAEVGRPMPVPSDQRGVGELIRERDEAMSRTRAMQEQVQELTGRIAQLQGELTYALEAPTRIDDEERSEARASPVLLPRFWLAALLLAVLVMQALTFMGILAVLALRVPW